MQPHRSDFLEILKFDELLDKVDGNRSEHAKRPELLEIYSLSKTNLLSMEIINIEIQ